MIPFATQRGAGQDLATHLLNAHDNECVEIAELRGSIAEDLHGAFSEWEAQAYALTKCKNYLYSLSVNPDPEQGPLTRDQYTDFIDRTEKQLGLSGQPRAVIFHEKYGREHCHVVWSRIDPENEKAIHLAFDREKLMMVTREFARDHDLNLPDGYNRDKKDRKKSKQLSLYEMHQQRATGLTKEERMTEVTEAWKQSDSPKAFMQALAERGYILATGKRPYVLIDIYGEMNSLPKLINDKSIRTKDIKVFLGKDYPAESLPSVEEAKEHAATHRKQIEQHLKNEQAEDAKKELLSKQTRRRKSLERHQYALKQKYHEQRLKLANQHKKERRDLRQGYLKQKQTIRIERFKNKPRGLAEFLGQISGVNFVRHQLHKWQDSKRERTFKAAWQKLRQNHKQKQKHLTQKHELRVLNLERKLRALTAIEKRELNSLAQSLKRDARLAARSHKSRIPALMTDRHKSGENSKRLDSTDIERNTSEDSLEEEFGRAASGKTRRKQIDLEGEFNRAADKQTDGEGKSSSDGPKPKPEDKIRRYGRKHRRDRNHDNER